MKNLKTFENYEVEIEPHFEFQGIKGTQLVYNPDGVGYINEEDWEAAFKEYNNFYLSDGDRIELKGKIYTLITSRNGIGFDLEEYSEIEPDTDDSDRAPIFRGRPHKKTGPTRNVGDP